MLNLDALNAAIKATAEQADKTKTVEEGATVVINSFAASVTKAVADALAADSAANQVSIDAATTAIEGVRAEFAASSDSLGAAVANVPPATPVV